MNKAFKNLFKAAFGVVSRHAVSKDWSLGFLVAISVIVRCCQDRVFTDFNMTANSKSFPTV